MRRLLIAVAVLVAMLGARTSVSAVGNAVVSFSPAVASGTVGASIPVDVMIANVDPSPGLANYDLTLHFDPAVVRLDLFKDSGFITSGQNVVLCVTGTIDNVAGAVEAQCQAIPLSGAPGVSTTSAIALLHASFTALTVGSSPLTISGSLAGPSGTAIPASFGNGAIHITAAGATSSPTAASTMTATASPAPVETSSPAPQATATADRTLTSVAASPVATVAAVKVPATGDGGGGSTIGNLTRILGVAGIIGAIAFSLLFLGRQRWRSHT